MDVFSILFCHGVEQNRFTTHSNGLGGLQQAHGWWPMVAQWVFTKSITLLWWLKHANVSTLRFDIFCRGSCRKSFYYPVQWARWIATVPWVIVYPPSMGFYKIYHLSTTLYVFFFLICKTLACFNHHSKVIHFVKIHWWWSVLSPMGMLGSLQPVGMGSKTILFNSMTK